jgi:hypothetical protein
MPIFPVRAQFPKVARHSLALAIALSAIVSMVLTTGCATRFPEDRVPKMKILVMDFEVPPGIKENPSAVRGWWLGARNVRQNPRAGTMFAERLRAYLVAYPWVSIFYKPELSRYFARKEQRLKEAYDYLDDAEIDELMAQVPQLDYARELGADKLLTGRVVENYLSENRTIHTWSSRSHIEVQMIDVLTGHIEWQKEYKERRRFASQFTVQDEIAQQVVEDLKEEYFRPMTVASAQ